MNYLNSLYNAHVYGRCAILDYNFNKYSTISSDIYYQTLSAPIVTTISSISSLIYTAISNQTENTISSTIYKLDLSEKNIQKLHGIIMLVHLIL